MAASTREYDVCAIETIVEGGSYQALAGRWHVLIVRTRDGIHALNNRCPHAAARLFPGRIDGGTVMCPRHGARFDLVDGHCVSAHYPAIRIFPTRTESGRVLVSVPEVAPALSEVPIP